MTSPARNQRLPLSVIILTYNEEANLPACLESLRGLGCEVFVVDSGSSDATREIAQAFGAHVSQHLFESHARQWNWALQNLSLSGEWILALDADQRLTPKLAQEIQEMLKDPPKGIDGFYLKRRQVFRGRWIRYGGYYPKYLLKLFRRDKARCDENEIVEHHFYIQGKTAKLKNDLVEANQKENDLSFWLDKHKLYALKQAQEEYKRIKNNFSSLIKENLFGNPDERTFFLKQLWYRLPLFVRPFLYFFYRYFVRLGFLDGFQGAIFHFYQGFWYRMLVDINLHKLRKARAHDPSRD